MSIVGLPEAAVREAKDRVRAAIQCAQFEFPARRITVNLAPADLPKDGGRFDLPIALGILAASGQIPLEALHEYEFLGELGLTGELRAVDGVLPAALAAARGRAQADRAGRQRRRSRAGARRRSLHRAHAAGSLRAARRAASRCRARSRAADRSAAADPTWPTCADRRMRGARWRSPRPATTTCCWSARPAAARPCSPRACRACCRKPAKPKRWKPRRSPRSAAAASIRRAGAQRPFRAPHHTASAVALVGGGAEPRPGRDLARAQRRAVPRRTARVGPTRAGSAARAAGIRRGHHLARGAAERIPGALPAGRGDEPLPLRLGRRPRGRCRCSRDSIQRYRARISGPLLDRIDLHVDVPRLPPAELRAGCAARRMQRRRCARA